MRVIVNLIDGRELRVDGIGRIETSDSYTRGPETLKLYFDDLDHPPFEYARERWTAFRVEREKDGR